jgi:hypothetical protein
MKGKYSVYEKYSNIYTSSQLGYRSYTLITIYISDMLSKCRPPLISKILIVNYALNEFNSSLFFA